MAVLLASLYEPENIGATTLQDALVVPRLVRGEIRSILHSLDHLRRSQAYWHVGEVVSQVRRWLEEAQALIQDQEYHDALLMLEAITDEYVKDWVILDDSDGLPSGFFVELGKAWDEVMRLADLTPAERRKWKRKLRAWQNEIGGYGFEGVFEQAGG